MLAVFEPQGPRLLSDDVTVSETFCNLVRHTLKPDKCDVDRWSQGQTTHPQTCISQQAAARLCFSTALDHAAREDGEQPAAATQEQRWQRLLLL